MPVYLFFGLGIKYMKTGEMPMALQASNVLYRKGNYGFQHVSNRNPDNHWDGRYYCWTSDPECGLDIAPKRPLLDLKDPTKVEKHNRDATVHAMHERTGFHGY
jgi:hypothetical protein